MSNLKMIESDVNGFIDTEGDRINSACNFVQCWRITRNEKLLSRDVFIVHSFSHCHFFYLLQRIALSPFFESRDTWNIWLHGIHGTYCTQNELDYINRMKSMYNEKNFLVLSRRFVLCIDNALLHFVIISSSSWFTFFNNKRKIVILLTN